jgi:uncharacterized membrane protein YqiK
LGVDVASDPTALRSLFAPILMEAVETVLAEWKFSEFCQGRERTRDRVICMIGEDLNGFRLDRIALHKVEQTPVRYYNAKNVRDVEGLQKIKEMTEA